MHRRASVAATASVIAVLFSGLHLSDASAAPKDRYRTVADAVAAGVVDPTLVAELKKGATTALVRVEESTTVTGPAKNRAMKAKAIAADNADVLDSLDATVADPSAKDLAHVGVRITTVRNERQLLALANRAVVTQIDADSQGKSTGITTVSGEEGDPSAQALLRQPEVHALGATGKGWRSYVIDDNASHGSNVSAIASGMAPSSTVIRNGSSLTQAQVLAAFDDVISRSTKGERIAAVNMSFYNSSVACTGTDTSFNKLRALGVVPVVSGGNSATSTTNWPMCSSKTVAVGAVYDSNFGSVQYPKAAKNCVDTVSFPDYATCFSSRSTHVDVFAPGYAISGAGSQSTGTSQAAPGVTGGITALRSAFPNATTDQMIAAITTSATKVNIRGTAHTRPRLDLVEAYDKLAGTPGAHGVSSPATRLPYEAGQGDLDLNNDGLEDVFLIPNGTANAVSWRATSQRGVFTLHDSGLNHGSNAYVGATGDFSGDGLGDVLADQSVLAASHTAYGTTTDTPKWIAANSNYHPYFYSSLNYDLNYASTDVNGDGFADVLTTQDGFDSRYGSSQYGVCRGSVTGATNCDVLSGYTAGGVPAGGDFDGDGYGDFFVYGTGPENDVIGWGSADVVSLVTTQSTVTMNEIARPIVGDFDGDGRDDIFWYGNGTTADSVWFGAATRGQFVKQASAFAIDEVDSLVVAGDYDGDGRDDILSVDMNGVDQAWYSEGRNDWDVNSLNVSHDGWVSVFG